MALEESGALTGYRASRLEQLQSDAAMLICNLQVRMRPSLLLLFLVAGHCRAPLSGMPAACSHLLPVLLPALGSGAGSGR